MEIMNDIDRLIANMGIEKVESGESVQPEGVLHDHQFSDYDPDFLDAILNEMVGGDVSTLENSANVSSAESVQPEGVLNDHQSSDYDPDFLDAILNEVGNSANGSSTAAPPSAEAEQVAQLKLQDHAPFHHSSSIASNSFFNGADSPAGSSTAIPVVRVTYQLDDQQMFILPANLSQDQDIPVVVTDTLPFQLINANSEITSATVADKNCPGEAPAATTIATNTPNSSGSRKRKLYEEDEFSDPEMEKKRQNAINAKKHRIRTKETIQDLQQRLNTKEQECVALTREVEEMKKKLEEEQSTHKMEVTTLRKSNEELMHKLKIWTHLTS